MVISYLDFSAKQKEERSHVFRITLLYSVSRYIIRSSLIDFGLGSCSVSAHVAKKNSGERRFVDLISRLVRLPRPIVARQRDGLFIAYIELPLG